MPQSAAVKVLVIDDERPVGEEICDALSLRNLSGHFAQDISKAREILSQEESLGVIVVDYHMPRMNGIEVIDILTKEFERPFVFVMLTGDETQQVAVEAIRAKAFDFLNKPVDGAKLSEAVHRALSHLATIRSSKDTESFLVEETKALKARVDELSSKLKHREGLLRQSLLAEHVAAGAVGEEVRESLRQLLAYAVQLRHTLAGPNASKQLSVVESMMLAELKLTEVLESIIPPNSGGSENAFTPSPVDLGSLIKRIGPAIQQMASEEGVKFKWRVSGKLPLIYADEGKLSRALIDISVGVARAMKADEELALMAIVAEQELIFTFRAVGAEFDEGLQRVLTDGLSQTIANLDDLESRWVRLIAARMTIHLHGGRMRVDEGPYAERFIRIFLPIPDDVRERFPNYNALSA